VPQQRTASSERGLLTLAGSLLVAGFLLYVIVTQFHPKGDENDHPLIFQKYADSDGWVAIHFGQFAGVLIAIGGLSSCTEPSRRGAPPVSSPNAGSLRLSLPPRSGLFCRPSMAWPSSRLSRPGRCLRRREERALRQRRDLRWTEWGLQAYFRLLLGLAFILFSIAAARARIVANGSPG